jgi:lysophospholipase L1-like esterase
MKTTDTDFYIALGDSMSIDDYAGGNGAVRLLSQHLGMGFENLARDGATSSRVIESQLPALWQSRKTPSLITLTIGGNDLLQAYGQEALATGALAKFRQNLPDILGQLRAKLGDVPILLANIYDPSDGTGNTVKMGLPVWTTALEWIGQFNAVIESEANAHNCHFIDLHQRFLGHGLSVGSPQQSLPMPDNLLLWYCGIIEPNFYGAQAICAAWIEALEALEAGE